MSLIDILRIVWAALNSPAGVVAIAGLALWLLNKVYGAKPAWQAFEGTIIAAVKYAEKAIPDDSPNKSLRRLDTALQYVLRVYQQMRGEASPADAANLKEGIQIVHARLEADGNLSDGWQASLN